MSLPYSDLSLHITRNLSKEEKKKDGIFFTPLETIKKNIDFLEPHFKDIHSILEPSCGSCEYIHALKTAHPNLNITGIELNKSVYESAKKNFPNIHLMNEDFIESSESTKYDLIIGNPPYYVLKKAQVDESYYEYFDGRPNIFVLFIIKSLKLLNEKGILSFVLPKNFLNCIYYSNTREYIHENFKILTIMECNDKYIDTQQETVIVIIQNVKDPNANNKFVLKKNNYSIFGTQEKITKLEQLYKNATTLDKLDFKVSVGKVVWNQCKDILSNDSKKTRLIYSSDIQNKTLVMKKYKDEKKKNFIDKEGMSEPLLVVNRGYGTGEYNFDYCLIEGGFNYVVENHLICIHYTKEKTNEELISLYKKVIKSLEDEKTKEFVNIYFNICNSQVELIFSEHSDTHIFSLYSVLIDINDSFNARGIKLISYFLRHRKILSSYYKFGTSLSRLLVLR